MLPGPLVRPGGTFKDPPGQAPAWRARLTALESGSLKTLELQTAHGLRDASDASFNTISPRQSDSTQEPAHATVARKQDV